MNPSTARTGPPTVLGVDPGGRWTGILVRRGVDVLAHVTVTRDTDEDADAGTRGVGVGPAYVADVCIAAAELADVHAVDLVAVESVVAPNPHVNRRNGKATTNPTGALGAAMVYGAILRDWPAAVIVAPAGNGSLPLSAYPPELVSDQERRRGLNRIGDGKLRHVRSAYDVAGRGPLYARQRASLHAVRHADTR